MNINDDGISSSSLPSLIDGFLISAYGAPLVYSDGGDRRFSWFKRLDVIKVYTSLFQEITSDDVMLINCQMRWLTFVMVHICQKIF